MDLFARCQCLPPQRTTTTLRQLHRMAFAMRGISRWAGKGGSDRTVQRCCSQALPGAMRCWVFFRQPGDRPGDVYLRAGDAVVVTTAGKHTDGLERCLASLYTQVGPGLSGFARSWGSVQERRSCPSRVEPIVRRAAEKAASRATAAAKQQPPSTTRRGPQRQEGSQRDNRCLPEQELQATTVEGPIQTRLDQAHLLHQEFPHALHGVMLVKTHLQTHAKAHVVLFRSDLERPDAQLKAYDGLRCQIACNGRDATQSWGLEDFRNVTEAAVTNAAPLS